MCNRKEGHNVISCRKEPPRGFRALDPLSLLGEKVRDAPRKSLMRRADHIRLQALRIPARWADSRRTLLAEADAGCRELEGDCA